jgi:ABC-type glycerol-3-phosphate transport system substrate-binding protein
MDTPEFLAGMNFVRDFFVTHQVAPTPDQNLSELFVSERLAMPNGWYGSQFTPGERAIAGRFKWNVGPVPKGSGLTLTINGQTIAANSNDKESGWQFLKWLMDPENHIPIVLTGGSRPALRESVLDHPRLMNEMKAHKVFAQLIKDAGPWQMPANYRWPEFNTTVTQVFANVWLGRETVEQALPEATRRLQAVMDKPAID